MFTDPWVSEVQGGSDTDRQLLNPDRTAESSRPSQRQRSEGDGYWEVLASGKIRYVSYDSGQIVLPPPGSSAYIAELRSYIPELEKGWKLWQTGSWFKDLMVTLTYAWSGYATGQFAGSLLEGGIPALGKTDPLSTAAGPQPLWAGLGSTKWTSLLEIGLGGVGEIFSFDYMGGDNQSYTESAWWGGFGSSLLTRGLRLYDLSPSWSEMASDALVDAGESILNYPVVGGPTSDALIKVEYNSAWWEELTGRPFFDADWEWFMDIYN